MFPVGIGEPVAAIGAYWRHAGKIADETYRLLEALARAMGAVLYTLDTISLAHEYRAGERRAWGVA